MTIWFATGNLHKKTELQAILSDHTIKIPIDAGITDFDPEENGNSFFENSFIKAKVLYDLVKEPVIADDSGLCVNILEGRPGIYSARYGGNITTQERNTLLLKELENYSQRDAYFVCAMVLMFNEKRFFLIQEALEGEIIFEERGKKGFGYDPIFYVPEFKRTLAELSEEEKNRISHRGKAGRLIQKILSETTKW